MSNTRLQAEGWKNKDGTSARSPACRNCGSWKDHWVNNSGKLWPDVCSVLWCTNEADVGAHIINPDVTGEYIVPTCSDCNHPTNTDEFALKGGVRLVSANQNKCKYTV